MFICKSWNTHKRLQKQYRTKNAGKPNYLPYFEFLFTVALPVILQESGRSVQSAWQSSLLKVNIH